MAKTADEIRKNADPQAVAAVLAQALEAGEIAPRAVFNPEWLMQKLSADLDRRTEQLQERIETQRQELQRDIARYETIRTEGLNAVSDYDLTIAYSGDAVTAVRESLRLCDAHISYSRSALLVLLVELASARDAIAAERRQMPLF